MKIMKLGNVTKRRTRSMLASAISLALLLGGCIVVPVAPFYDEPLPSKTLTELEPGASKDAVMTLIGVPHAIRSGGRYWYYGATRPALLAGVPIGQGIGGVFQDYKWIEIEFDDASKLLHIERQESKSGCARSGNCVLSFGLDPHKMSDSAIIVAAPQQDERAKQFQPPTDGCATYVYYDAGFLLQGPISVRVDDASRWLDQNTYTRFEVKPGDVQIVTDPAHSEGKASWHCMAGEISFFHLFSRWSDRLVFTGHVEPVDETSGKEEILKRRLLLAP
jgi:outer membrane protein assembly factor BamE (lipoprotein component of BamABCDE complex)